jgi:hypothetical protein
MTTSPGCTGSDTQKTEGPTTGARLVLAGGTAFFSRSTPCLMCPEGVILPVPMKITRAPRASAGRTIRLILCDPMKIVLIVPFKLENLIFFIYMSSVTKKID